MSQISPDQLIQALNWRYATKAFDPERKIPDETWSALEESLVLTPSSFGLQPWKFVVVRDSAIREELVSHSWNQRQVADASHLLVVALKTDMGDERVDEFIERTEDVRDQKGQSGPYRDMMAGFIARMDAAQTMNWAKLQTYIALGQFMTSAALLGIDTCPMEGFVAEKYDEILGLKDLNLSASVLCPAGYRASDDKYASLPKVRFEHSDVVTYI